MDTGKTQLLCHWRRRFVDAADVSICGRRRLPTDTTTLLIQQPVQVAGTADETDNTGIAIFNVTDIY